MAEIGLNRRIAVIHRNMKEIRALKASHGCYRMCRCILMDMIVSERYSFDSYQENG